MSCGPPTMIVAVVDFKDWGLQIIALCDRIGKDYNTSCHRIGKEKRCLKFLKKRIGSHDLAKRWGVLSWFNMFRYVSEKILSRRVMSRGCFTLLNRPRPVKSVYHSTLSPRNANTFPILDTSYWIVSTTYRWAQRKRRKLCLCWLWICCH